MKAAGSAVNALLNLGISPGGPSCCMNLHLGRFWGLKGNCHLTIRRTLLGEANQIATHATPYETIATVKAKE